VIALLLPPTTGTAHVAGFDIVRQAAQVRRVIGYVPQLLSADGALSGYENLLVFASNAIYPIAIMPPWLQAIAYANPLTYEVDGLPALMLGSSKSTSGLTLDFVVMLVVTTALVVIGGWLYPKVVV
jgi:ABC-type uncharacterized transport system permease subunit